MFAGAWERSAASRADQPFLVFEGPDGGVASWTYGELDGVLGHMAARLASCGVVDEADTSFAGLPERSVERWPAPAPMGRAAVMFTSGTLRHCWFAQNLADDQDDQYETLAEWSGCPPRQLYGMNETIPAVLTDEATDPRPGRRADVLEVSGENVSVVEVEGVLSAHPEVLEACVVGAPDPVRDVVPEAFVVQLRPVADDEAAGLVADLERWCEGRLATAKWPQRYTLVDELPRTSVGKIRKYVLEEEATR